MECNINFDARKTPRSPPFAETSRKIDVFFATDTNHLKKVMDPFTKNC